MHTRLGWIVGIGVVGIIGPGTMNIQRVTDTRHKTRTRYFLIKS